MASFFEASIALSLLVYTVAKDTSRIHDRKRDKKIETHSPSHLRFILKVIPGFSSYFKDVVSCSPTDNVNTRVAWMFSWRNKMRVKPIRLSM